MDGEHVAYGLADIIVNPPAVPYRFDDGMEIIIQQNQVGGFPGHFAAALAHGDADIRPLQSRRVIDAVTGHGHDGAVFLQSADDTHLMFRDDPGKNRRGTHRRLQSFIVQGIQFRSGQDLTAAFHPDLPGDSCRGDTVIAGNHDHPDPGCPADGNIFCHPRTGRIRQSHQTLQRQTVICQCGR